MKWKNCQGTGECDGWFYRRLPPSDGDPTPAWGVFSPEGYIGAARTVPGVMDLVEVSLNSFALAALGEPWFGMHFAPVANGYTPVKVVLRISGGYASIGYYSAFPCPPATPVLGRDQGWAVSLDLPPIDLTEFVPTESALFWEDVPDALDRLLEREAM